MPQLVAYCTIVMKKEWKYKTGRWFNVSDSLWWLTCLISRERKRICVGVAVGVSMCQLLVCVVCVIRYLGSTSVQLWMFLINYISIVVADGVLFERSKPSVVQTCKLGCRLKLTKLWIINKRTWSKSNFLYTVFRYFFTLGRIKSWKNIIPRVHLLADLGLIMSKNNYQ